MKHTNRDIVHFIQLVNERADDRDVNSEIPELLQTHIVLDDRYHVPSYAVDVGVYWKMRVGVDMGGENWLLVVFVGNVFLQERRPLRFLNLKAPTSIGALALSLALAVTSVSIVMGHLDRGRIDVGVGFLVREAYEGEC